MLDVEFELFGYLIFRGVRSELLPLAEVRMIELENAEPAVLMAGVSGFVQFRCGPADTLFRDVRYRGIAGLVSFAILIRRFWKLYADESAFPAVFGVQRHHGMSGRTGTGEEVEDKVVGFGGNFEAALDEADRFRVTEICFSIEKFFDFLGSILAVSDIFILPNSHWRDAVFDFG